MKEKNELDLVALEAFFCNELVQLLMGWKSGCSPDEWSFFDETTLVNSIEWHRQLFEIINPALEDDPFDHPHTIPSLDQSKRIIESSSK